MNTSNSPATNTSAAVPRVIALGASADELQALSTILAKLPANFPASVIIVQHLSPHSPSLPSYSSNQVADILGRRTALRIKEPKEGDHLQAGIVYVAPPAKHLMVRPDGTLALSGVQEARPAVDILFSSLASSMRAKAIAVVLASVAGVGVAGIRAIKAAGGVTLAQDDKTPQNFRLSGHAAAKEAIDFVLPLPEIAATLVALVSEPSSPRSSSNHQPFPAKQSPSSSTAEALPFTRSEPVKHEAINREPIKSKPTPLASNALDRVQRAWRIAEDFPGEGAGTQPVSRLMTKALEELDDCVDTLRFAEQALIAQNDALERLQQTTRDERLRYQALLGVVSDGVITTDLQGIIRAVNPAAAQLLGRNARYMVGRPLGRYVQQNARPHGSHLTLDSIIAQAVRTKDKQLTLCLRTRSGTTAVSATASVIENQEGAVVGLHWLAAAS